MDVEEQPSLQLELAGLNETEPDEHQIQSYEPPEPEPEVTEEETPASDTSVPDVVILLVCYYAPHREMRSIKLCTGNDKINITGPQIGHFVQYDCDESTTCLRSFSGLQCRPITMFSVSFTL